jgi:four helix bundle protein
MFEDDDSERPPTFENGQDIRDRTFAFACRVVKFCQKLNEDGGVGRLMAPQLINCSTSMPAMLEEARAAESDADLVSKCCISLKETRESKTRLAVCEACRLGPAQEASALVKEAGEIVAIIATIIQNKRRSMKAKSPAPRQLRRRILNS